MGYYMATKLTNCAECGKPLESYQFRFCSTACRVKHHNGRNYGDRPRASLSTSTTGAVAELMVAGNLMESGLHVFRALSPTCFCDLAVIHAPDVLMVEVRTAYRKKASDVITWPRTKERADFYGLYVREEELVYYHPISDKGRLFLEAHPLLRSLTNTEIEAPKPKPPKRPKEPDAPPSDVPDKPRPTLPIISRGKMTDHELRVEAMQAELVVMEVQNAPPRRIQSLKLHIKRMKRLIATEAGIATAT